MPLTVRAPALAFEDIPRHWFGGSAVATHVANGINLLFPSGERMFIRSVRHYLDRLDPETVEEVRRFFGQEGRHAAAHERYMAALERQGYRLRPFLDWYERTARAIERVTPPALRLSVTVALEHYTATFAEHALAGGLVADAHPSMQRLLFWHAAEEIEHKAVAFDVLRRVNPSYALRMAGLVVGTVTLLGYWFVGTRALLRQDGVPRREILRELRRIHRRKPIGRRVFARGVRQYLRRDFHPNDHDTAPLARAYLETLS
jgi:predicted metal-dependent hydrolase